MVSDSSNRYRRHSRSPLPQIKTESTLTYELEKNNNSYSSVTITVNDQKLKQTYTVYKHTPSQTSNLMSTKISYNKKSLTIVPNTTIAKKQDKLESLDGKIFTEICTYCLETNSDEHLLLKLTTNSNNVYLLYRFGKDGNKWRQLALKELLNFSIISLEQMKDMENRLISEGLSNVMKEIISNNTSNTKALLDQINFEVNSCIVLLENLKGYQKDSISSVLGSEKMPSVNNENKIFVNDETDKDEGECIRSENYKVYKQHLQSLGDEKLKKEDELFLRLYLFGNRINLYNSSDGTGELTYLKYISDNKYLNVFFYDKDPRPLLLCYENKVYRPLNKENYLNKWIKIGDIRGCDCKDNEEKGSKLLKLLLETAYFMNPIKINHGLDRNKDSSRYTTHRFTHDNKEINVEISLISEELNCYKGYKHELGKPSYTLGEISYNGNKLFTDYENYIDSISPENKSKSLDKILVYYYMYDAKHEHPLMIELKYEGDDNYSTFTSDYYRLMTKDSDKKWVKIDEKSQGSDKIFIGTVKRIENEINQEMKTMAESISSEEYFELNEMETMSSGKEEELTDVLERKLDEIRNDLNIEYIMTEDKLIMSPNNCTKNNTGAIAGTVATIGLVGTGGGILIYKYQAIIVSYLRSLFN